MEFVWYTCGILSTGISLFNTVDAHRHDGGLQMVGSHSVAGGRVMAGIVTAVGSADVGSAVVGRDVVVRGAAVAKVMIATVNNNETNERFILKRFWVHFVCVFTCELSCK